MSELELAEELECQKFMEEFEKTKLEYIEKIANYKFLPPRCLPFDVENVSAYSSQDLEKDLKGIKTNAVYIIASQKPLGEDQKKFYEQCKENGFCMSRDMDSGSSHNEKAPCLYVGSSITDVNTRLKQHIGISDYKSIYALHLSKWWSDASLKITVYHFEKIEDYGLQFIEDRLWEKYKPIFGRKGSR
jgi:hypothetical protein